MSVIRLRPGQACHRCGSTTALPHADHYACLAAIGNEVRALLDRTRELSLQRRHLIERQATNIEKRRRRIAASLNDLRKPKRKHSA